MMNRANEPPPDPLLSTASLRPAREGDLPWLDQDQPHEPERSEAQVEALLALFDPPPAHILDLGCGGGRLLLPLARAGHGVVGLDRDAAALRRCEDAAGDLPLTLFKADFLTPGWAAPIMHTHVPFDAALLLGNNLMTVWEIERAVELLRQIGQLLRPGGRLVIDDIPHDLWPSLTEGRWISGLAGNAADETDGPPAAGQIVWSPDDAVFALRFGEQVDAERWALDDQDTRYRLWTMGCLTLAARLAGLSAPIHDARGGLLVLERSHPE